jgi:hypothetical protein
MIKKSKRHEGPHWAVEPTRKTQKKKKKKKRGDIILQKYSLEQ